MAALPARYLELMVGLSIDTLVVGILIKLSAKSEIYR
jgi:hypothetical protein